MIKTKVIQIIVLLTIAVMLLAAILFSLVLKASGSTTLNQTMTRQGQRVYYRFIQSGQTCPAYVQQVDCGLDMNGGYFSLVNTYVGYPCNTSRWMDTRVYYNQRLIGNFYPTDNGDGIAPRIQQGLICEVIVTAGPLNNKVNLFGYFLPDVLENHPYP